MSGERARRFPLGLEDLVREPRRPEGRPGEVRAATLAATPTASAALNARQQAAKGAPLTNPQSRAANPPAKPQASPQGKPQASSSKASPASNARAGAVSGGSVPVRPAVNSSLKGATAKGASFKAAPLNAAAQMLSGRPAPAAASSVARSTVRSGARAAPPNAAWSGAMSGAMALTSERVRERMVERLRANGVTDQRVLNAMAVVPRHMFVDPGLATQAYEDAALPIGHHQTISKPSVVARMIELAATGRVLNTVLEVGTGCGYQAAVLSQVARDVYSIERIKPLSERAKTNLRPLRIPNIRLHYGDGRLGLPAAAPFDAIVIAAAGLDVPQALLEQLAIGGRLVAPVGTQDGQTQVLTLVERLGPAQWRESRLDRVFFVPLKSGVI
jgi:protein-L-isoaspartate(D-aspartate) O-methyltransferase